MRKLFSLLAAVLFAGSMMAGEVVFTKADFTGQGTVSTGSPVSATKDGVTFSYSKGYCADESLRCYAHGELSVTAPFIIQKINFTTTGGKDGGLEAEVKVNATSYKVADLASQARFTEIKVTFDGEGDTTVVPVDTTVVPVDTTVVPVDTTVVPVDTTVVPALEGIVITPSDFTPVTSADYSTTKEGVKVAVAASTVTEDQIRIFKGKTITISAATAITGIEFTCTAKGTAKYGPGCFQAQNGYTFEKDGDKGTWVGSATKVTFTAESNQVRVTQIIVALSGQGGGDTTVVPVDTTDVEGITCLDVYQMQKGDVVGLLNTVTVTYANGKNVWVRDGSASMLIFLPEASEAFKAGDVLSGVAGTVDVYNGVHEVKPSAEQVNAIVATPGEAPQAIPASVVEIYDVNKYIVMDGVEAVGAFEEGKQANLTINGVAVRNQFKNGYTFEEGKLYNIYGVVTIYQNNPQVYFISAEVAGELEPTVQYYVCGTMTNWQVDEAYKLKANPAVAGEFMGDFTFADQAEFKIIGVLDSTITWYPDGMDNNFNISEQGGDYTVYFRPEGGVDGWFHGYFTVIERETPLGPTTCAEAAEAALSVSANNELYNNGAVYTIEGYVTSIKTAYSDKFHNISFWMADTVDGGEVLQAYRAACASAADAPNVGDKVAVTGSLTKYNTTPEFAAACTYTILERAELVDSIAWDFVASQYVVFDGDGYVDVILFTNETYFVEEGDEGYEIYGDGDGVMLVLDIAYTDLADMAGTYQSSDLSLDLDYSYAVSFVGEQSTDIEFSSGTVTLVADTAQEGYILTYSLVGTNGVTYEGSANIPLFEGEDPEIPTAEQTVDVVITDGEIQADEDGFWVLGLDSTEIWIQLLISGSEIAGLYTEEDLDLTQSAVFTGEDYTEIYTANLVIADNGNGAYTLTGSILCYNNTLYNVTMILTDTSMGIEEALAAGKAVKMIRNGVLVIEKAGVKHSVMGQQIR